MTVGLRLRWLLELEGRSIKELSEASGIPYRTLQQYLSDNRKPGADHMVRFADAGIDLHWLLLGQEEASLKLLFPRMEPIDGPLAADSKLAVVFLDEAMKAVDEFHDDYVRKSKKPLHLDILMTGVWSVFSLYDNLLKNISEQIINKRKEGWPGEDIAQFVLSSPVRDEVRSRLKRIWPEIDEDSGQ